jgi:hypothetical protein
MQSVDSIERDHIDEPDALMHAEPDAAEGGEEGDVVVDESGEAHAGTEEHDDDENEAGNEGDDALSDDDDRVTGAGGLRGGGRMRSNEALTEDRAVPDDWVEAAKCAYVRARVCVCVCVCVCV